MRSSSVSEPARLDARLASRLAAIALSHVTREYPNKLDHVLESRSDVKGPRALHPVFYGSFDWHSCVHSYWLLASLYRLYPHMPEAAKIRSLFGRAFTKAKIAGECAYLKRESARLFERPYGWAWLLMLQAELMRQTTPEARAWAFSLQPLATIFVARFCAYLPKAAYPNRAGTHGNSAFALALAHEYALVAKDEHLAAMLRTAARRWYAKDADCQAWEPSGEDFLSPALMEAECMRRTLAARSFGGWFQRFLPHLAKKRPATLFVPARVTDRTDGRIVHLDGSNLSRAWCWRGVAQALPAENLLHAIATRAAERHLAVSLGAISGHYMGEHWLASFALLALRP